MTAQAGLTSDKAVCKLQEAAPAQADGISQPEHPAGHTAEEVLPAQRAAPDAPSQPQERPALLLGHAGMLHSQGSLPKQVLQQGHHQLQAQGALDRAPSAGTEPPQRKRPREAQALGPAGAHAEVQPRKRQTRMVRISWRPVGRPHRRGSTACVLLLVVLRGTVQLCILKATGKPCSEVLHPLLVHAASHVGAATTMATQRWG